MKKIDSFSIVIPAFNEQDNIAILLDEIFKALENSKYNFEVIIIDDNSNDKTNFIATNYLKIKNKKIIRSNVQNGQSKSILIGIKLASFDNIVTIDADLQNDPKDILELAEVYFSNKEYKMVAGIRIKRKDSFIKIISSKIANKIRSSILKDNCPDTGCSLKIFNKNIFLQFKFFNGIHRFLPALFIGYNYKITYVKVNHRPRLNGVSKYGTINRLFWGIRDIIRVNRMIKYK